MQKCVLCRRHVNLFSLRKPIKHIIWLGCPYFCIWLYVNDLCSDWLHYIVPHSKNSPHWNIQVKWTGLNCSRLNRRIYTLFVVTSQNKKRLVLLLDFHVLSGEWITRKLVFESVLRFYVNPFFSVFPWYGPFNNSCLFPTEREWGRETVCVCEKWREERERTGD